MTKEEYNQSMKALSKELNEKWDSYDIDHRTELMQRIENLEAQNSNRPPATVSREYMKPSERGVYYHSDNTIQQNNDMVQYGSSEMCLKNILHEGQHAYQYHCLDHPELHPEVDQETLEVWQIGFQTYVDPNDDCATYGLNVVEFNANQVAEAKVHDYEKSLSNGEKESNDLEDMKNLGATEDQDHSENESRGESDGQRETNAFANENSIEGQIKEDSSSSQIQTENSESEEEINVMSI